MKVAVLADDATNSATTYTVKKGHNFKVGDVLMLASGKAAYAITAIATNSGDATKDDLTVGTTLGVAAKPAIRFTSQPRPGLRGQLSNTHR